jgi:hypothetical protein
LCRPGKYLNFKPNEVSNEKEAHTRFGFSRIFANSDYSKHPECFFEHFFLEYYDAPGNFSSDFIHAWVCHWLFDSKNQAFKIRG